MWLGFPTSKGLLANRREHRFQSDDVFLAWLFDISLISPKQRCVFPLVPSMPRDFTRLVITKNKKHCLFTLNPAVGPAVE